MLPACRAPLRLLVLLALSLCASESGVMYTLQRSTEFCLCFACAGLKDRPGKGSELTPLGREMVRAVLRLTVSQLLFVAFPRRKVVAACCSACVVVGWARVFRTISSDDLLPVATNSKSYFGVVLHYSTPLGRDMVG